MTSTFNDIGVNDSITNKLFSKALYHEAIKKTYFFSRDLIGDDKILYLKDELAKNAGDSITYQMTNTPTGIGRTSGETLEGNEEKPTIYSDSLLINELWHALRVKNEGTIDQKRVAFNLRQNAMKQMADWAAVTLDAWVFNALAGNTATTITFDGRTYNTANALKATGYNAATAPTTNRIKRAGGQATDQALTSSDKFTLGIVDACLEEAELSTTGAGRIQPLIIDGEERYVMFISHEHYVDLKRDNSSAIQWFDIQKSALQGGMQKDNPIFTGAVGTYDKVIFHKTSRLPNGVHSSTAAAVANTKRAIFCGRGAGCIAFGNGGIGESAFKWTEELFDYKRELGVAVGLVAGVKKCVFNSEDAGVIVASTYAARHNS